MLSSERAARRVEEAMRLASDAHVGLRTAATCDFRAAPRAPSDSARWSAAAQSSRVILRNGFEAAVLQWLPTLRLHALRLTRSSADADDLLQETLLRAYRFWPRYQERASCRAWLQRILDNTFRTEYRRQQRRKLQLAELEAERDSEVACEREEPVQEAPSASAALSGGLDERLGRGLSSLSPEQRSVIWLVDVRERSYREAADELACPIGTVMSRLHRARAALRSALLAQA
jgi:RNA polymerase sigma-70 factor, ECF subfamily